MAREEEEELRLALQQSGETTHDMGVLSRLLCWLLTPPPRPCQRARRNKRLRIGVRHRPRCTRATQAHRPCALLGLCPSVRLVGPLWRPIPVGPPPRRLPRAPRAVRARTSPLRVGRGGRLRGGWAPGWPRHAHPARRTASRAGPAGAGSRRGGRTGRWCPRRASSLGRQPRLRRRRGSRTLCPRRRSPPCGTTMRRSWRRRPPRWPHPRLSPSQPSQLLT